MTAGLPLDRRRVALDCAAEAERISRWMRRAALANRLRRRGLVVAISGGVDSSVCAALAVRALRAERVSALLLPERDSCPSAPSAGRCSSPSISASPTRSSTSPPRSRRSAATERRDEAIRVVFPPTARAGGSKLVIAGGLAGGYQLLQAGRASRPTAQPEEARLPAREYLEIVAATNFKQRMRKTIDYFHADRLNYAVVGTPNRLEYDQGFFVKNGDGAADLKPIAHLYKTQVYALAR